uniref:Large ribosomal subunit protein mL43 n=1 Tax=Cyclophora tenuis TaxID=216820 RepID=A0A7S1GKP3_CYCTE|mmetsp:Transcript_19965/g.34105  ORF Transcript_19965/g.34105 Transcript_19965/m.34105 type:complete len:135 (+) Transcript_19965:97-501(+)
MATRGVYQLARLRLVYCEHGGSSRTIRDYISSGRIVQWAKDHPHVEVEVHVRNGKHPLIEGEYLTGQPKQITVKNQTMERIQQVVDMLHNSSGRKIKKLKRTVVTQTPSVQGVWTPMLDLQNTKFTVGIEQGHT